MLEALPAALRQASRALPPGEGAPELGPEERRRIGLARARGRAIVGEGWSVACLPSDHFHPLALPRMVTLHPVRDAAELHRVLAPWQDHLSSIGVSRGMRNGDWAEVMRWFMRVDEPGRLQRPGFPRTHDGKPMLGSVLLS